MWKWRRKSRELYAAYDYLSITSLARYILRTEDSRIGKKAYRGSPGGMLSIGRPRSRWKKDSVLSDVKQLGINSLAHDRYRCTTVVEQPKGSCMHLLRQFIVIISLSLAFVSSFQFLEFPLLSKSSLDLAVTTPYPPPF